MSQSSYLQARIENRLPVAREGLPFIFSGLAGTVLLFVLGLYILAGVALLFTLFSTYFFRDPERTPTGNEKAVLSPADGQVILIEHMKGARNLLGKPSIKISIFMSVFNVHVNRIPLAGHIRNISYHPGKFIAANLDKSSEENENNRVTLETKEGTTILVVQIAGLIARRIACWVGEGDEVKAGQRFGLIRFGSRLDVYLPEDAAIQVKLRQKVRSGETILGHLK